MTVSIASELIRIQKLEYLEGLSLTDLAFWLINSFTPERFRAGNADTIEAAIKILYERSHDKLLIAEFVERLWGMHGLQPDYSPNIFQDNVISFRRN